MMLTGKKIYPSVGISCLFVTASLNYKNKQDYNVGVTIITPFPSITSRNKGN